MTTPTLMSQTGKRSLVAPNFSVRALARTYSHFPPTRRRCLFQQAGQRHIKQSRRTLSATPHRRFADVDNSFDPRQQDRESDEVDVCIVGGGMSCPSLNSHETHRTELHG